MPLRSGGPWIFLTGHEGFDFASGIAEAVAGPPRFPGLSHAGYGQAAAVHGYAEALSEAAGTSLAKLLRAQYFVSDIAAFSGIAMARISGFGVQALPFVCVQTPPAMPAPGAVLIADF